MNLLPDQDPGEMAEFLPVEQTALAYLFYAASNRLFQRYVSENSRGEHAAEKDVNTFGIVALSDLPIYSIARLENVSRGLINTRFRNVKAIWSYTPESERAKYDNTYPFPLSRKPGPKKKSDGIIKGAVQALLASEPPHVVLDGLTKSTVDAIRRELSQSDPHILRTTYVIDRRTVLLRESIREQEGPELQNVLDRLNIGFVLKETKAPPETASIIKLGFLFGKGRGKRNYNDSIRVLKEKGIAVGICKSGGSKIVFIASKQRGVALEALGMQ